MNALNPNIPGIESKVAGLGCLADSSVCCRNTWGAEGEDEETVLTVYCSCCCIGCRGGTF